MTKRLFALLLCLVMCLSLLPTAAFADAEIPEENAAEEEVFEAPAEEPESVEEPAESPAEDPARPFRTEPPEAPLLDRLPKKIKIQPFVFLFDGGRISYNGRALRPRRADAFSLGRRARDPSALQGPSWKRTQEERPPVLTRRRSVCCLFDARDTDCRTLRLLFVNGRAFLRFALPHIYSDTVEP